MYTVLWCHEDGLNIKRFTKEELLEALNPNCEDYNLSRINWHSDLRNNYELMNSCFQGIILKGGVVVPFEKTVVTEMDIE